VIVLSSETVGKSAENTEVSNHEYRMADRSPFRMGLNKVVAETDIDTVTVGAKRKVHSSKLAVV
jgi:hypothetical protein